MRYVIERTFRGELLSSHDAEVFTLADGRSFDVTWHRSHYSRSVISRLRFFRGRTWQFPCLLSDVCLIFTGTQDGESDINIPTRIRRSLSLFFLRFFNISMASCVTNKNRWQMNDATQVSVRAGFLWWVKQQESGNINTTRSYAN